MSPLLGLVISCVEGVAADMTRYGARSARACRSVNGKNMCVNNYDVRLTDTHPACGMNWPPDLSDITPYLSRADVKSAFHANRKEGGWSECNGNVGANFWVYSSKPAVTLLPALLEKVPMLFFAGEQDLICNHVGIERMLDNLTWAGETGFGVSPICHHSTLSHSPG